MLANFLANAAGVAGPNDAGNAIPQTGKGFAEGYFCCRGQPWLGMRVMLGIGALIDRSRYPDRWRTVTLISLVLGATRVVRQGCARWRPPARLKARQRLEETARTPIQSNAAYRIPPTLRHALGIPTFG